MLLHRVVVDGFVVLSFVLAQVIERHVAGDIEHPGFEATVAAKGLGLLEYPQEDVLGEIFALRTVPRDLQDELVDGAVMPLEQGREARGVAVCDPLNKLFVCHGSHDDLLAAGMKNLGHVSYDAPLAKTLQNNVSYYVTCYIDDSNMTEQHSYLARHLRMVSLQMMEAGAEICSELDPVLKPTWLSLISGLADSRRTTVMDTAREMNVSHVHAQNILKSMKAADVVSATADPDDGRRTFYELTAKGLELVPKVEQIRDAMGAAVDDIEKETGADLFAAVALFRQALQQQDWTTRVKGNLK